MNKKLAIVIIIGVFLLGSCSNMAGKDSDTEKEKSSKGSVITKKSDIAKVSDEKKNRDNVASTVTPVATKTNTPVSTLTQLATQKEFEGVFAFADESGRRLIAVLQSEDSALKNPENYNIALGNNGDVIKLKYIKMQDRNSKDNGRESMNNFNNIKGYIFEAQDGEFVKDKTYLISKEPLIKKYSLVKLKSTKNNESRESSYKKVDRGIIEKIESIKNRKIIESSLISETDENAKICLFVFGRRKSDMLASIVYIKDEKIIVKDFPAKYNESSTWRVDAGDKPGLFGTLFLLNSKDGLLLGLTWAAPEGEVAFVLNEANGIFVDTSIQRSRYWSPA